MHYQLVWSDEFNADHLELTKWQVCDEGSGFGNAELQYYSPRTKMYVLKTENFLSKHIKKSMAG